MIDGQKRDRGCGPFLLMVFFRHSRQFACICGRFWSILMRGCPGRNGRNLNAPTWPAVQRKPWHHLDDGNTATGASEIAGSGDKKGLAPDDGAIPARIFRRE
jgi:hypothetical protein